MILSCGVWGEWSLPGRAGQQCARVMDGGGGMVVVFGIRVRDICCGVIYVRVMLGFARSY